MWLWGSGRILDQRVKLVARQGQHGSYIPVARNTDKRKFPKKRILLVTFVYQELTKEHTFKKM